MPQSAADSQPATATYSPSQKVALEWLQEAVDGLGGQERPGQVTMAAEVVEAIEKNRHLLVQAGTGTGKSLAYLVPALHHAMNSDKPVVISTATLALQSQVMSRDLPRLLDSLEDKLPREAVTALVKGRSNYVCRNKLAGGFPEDEGQEALIGMLDDGAAVPLTEQTPQAATSFGSGLSELGEQIQRLRAWAAETETGDRDDLSPGVSDRAWRQVSVSARECLGSKCQFYDECFVEQSRAHAATADIVVTNHALLAFSAIEGYGVLPEHDVVIIDEAHELQDRITTSVSTELSAAAMKAAATSTRKHTSVSPALLEEAIKDFENAFNATSDGLLEMGLNQAQEAALAAVLSATRTLLSDTKDSGKDQDAGRQVARSRLQAVYDAADRVMNSAQGITGSAARAAGPAHEALWLTRPRTHVPGKGYQDPDPMTPPQLWVAPISVAGPLKQGLLEDRTVILTSATLAIGGDFASVAGSIGLSREESSRWRGLDVGSPFDYPRQGILYAAQHLPEPTQQRSPESLSEIRDLMEASGGGALGLFSSIAAAKEVTAYIRDELDMPILCQGESSMADLIRRFSEDKDLSLFGTMSLWQGVDVPGDALRLVIIDRIPFPRPDDPMSKARSLKVARAGGNGFLTVSATHAAMRLAQGVGRLIRSSDDRGVVAIIDSRIVKKSYGGFIKSALPDFWSTTDRDKILQVLKRLSS
ncbi:ATP-dependent DNA helicase [Micrococcoides hystricis]|uniref:DNA 5'-3' helicase n=1 Tax=Micrococcoides hystricis TaxID=1572761 RepID=A0ABV6P8K9_9MICC